MSGRLWCFSQRNSFIFVKRGFLTVNLFEVCLVFFFVLILLYKVEGV